MKEKTIEQILEMNFKLLTLLGFGSAIIHDFMKVLPTDKHKSINWFMKAVENIVYLDKPLPPMP